MSVHLPAYLVDRGLPAEIGGWTLAIIGLFNIVGAIAAGWLSAFLPKRYILAFIYFGRAVAILVYIMLPPSAAATLVFGAVLGLFWLSTVPPTSGLVAVMFGTRWITMLFGLTFFSHQVGGFLGVWLGGVLFERTGSYDAIWWLSILLGLFRRSLICRSWRSRWNGSRRPDGGGRQKRTQCKESREPRPKRSSARLQSTLVRLPGARPRHCRVRLPDRHDQLRAARDVWLLSDGR